MKIVVINLKGGVGKTPLSFNIAKDFDMDIITNDHSALEIVYPDRTTITNDLVLKNNTVYDLGGFASHGTREIVQGADLVIVPCFNDYSSLSQTISTLNQLEDPQRVVVAVTKTENKDFAIVKDELNKYFDGLEYFEFGLTKAFKSSIEYGESIIDLIKQDKVINSWYKNYAQKYIYPLQKYIFSIKSQLGEA